MTDILPVKVDFNDLKQLRIYLGGVSSALDVSLGDLNIILICKELKPAIELLDIIIGAYE